MRLISLWFGLRTPVSRRAYAASGFHTRVLEHIRAASSAS
jgi:hypothetical protein